MRITYAHCTLGNHVYYARYLDLLEAARGEFFRSIAFPCVQLQAEEVVFQISECSLKYLKPARYDDLIDIRIRLSEVRKVRLRFHYDVLRGADKLLEASTLAVCMDLHERPRRIPEAILRAFQPFIHDSAVTSA